MKALIVLGCEGRVDNNFKFCNGVYNIILDLEVIRASENYKSLIEYLNCVVKIFDNPCCNLNVISNAIYKIYELGYINKEIYDRINNFYNFHRRCGLILQCFPKKLEDM
jgi:hypothetical protein